MAVEESPYDIAMKFVLQGGGTVWAESTMRVDKSADPLMKDFNSVDNLNDYSNFFEVSTFDFAVSNDPDDGAAGNLSGKGPTIGAHRAGAQASGGRSGMMQTGPGGRGGDAAPGQGSSDAYHRWRSATEDQAKKMIFQLTFDSFRFTRFIDGASPSFFQNCAQQVSFESAALVKRISQGGLGGVTRPNLAFLRFDFKKVMLKSVKWDDGDLVSESVEFVCDWMSFQYRQQMPDGSLLPVAHMATWDRETDSKRKKEDGTSGR